MSVCLPRVSIISIKLGFLNPIDLLSQIADEKNYFNINSRLHTAYIPTLVIFVFNQSVHYICHSQFELNVLLVYFADCQLYLSKVKSWSIPCYVYRSDFDSKVNRLIDMVVQRIGINVGDRFKANSRKVKFVVSGLPPDSAFPIKFTDFQVDCQKHLWGLFLILLKLQLCCLIWK